MGEEMAREARGLADATKKSLTAPPPVEQKVKRVDGNTLKKRRKKNKNSKKARRKNRK